MRERLEPEPGRLVGQLLGVRRPVEEREVGVAVELGVRDVAVAPLDPVRLERLPLPAPRRPVTAGVPRRAPRAARRARCGPLPDRAASSSFHVHDGLLNPIGRVSNDCPPNASSSDQAGQADGDHRGCRPKAASKTAPAGSSNVPSTRGPIAPAER